MPRVAFVNLVLGSSLLGVEKAIAGQARAARQIACPIDFVLVNAERTGIQGDIHYVRYSSLPIGTRGNRLFKFRLLDTVKELRGYDVLILRYPLAVDLAPSVFFRSERKVITVHHAKELEELAIGTSTLANRTRILLERINGRKVLERVDGIVGVTDEIRQYELARVEHPPRSTTISNGVDVESIRLTGFRPFDGKTLHVLFVASTGASWHGTDRLIESLRSYRGNSGIVLHLVGTESPTQQKEVHETDRLTLHYHGPLTGTALDAVCAQATVAISSLAVFRKNLRQACALKTREYIARGIPFVYGYDDVDLGEELPFCVRVPNEARPFAPEVLFDLAERASRHSALSESMRAFAAKQLDWSAKMPLFYKFATATGSSYGH